MQKYKTFDTDTITQIEKICQFMISLALKHNTKAWAKKQKETYEGLLQFVHQNQSLSSNQCKIIAVGCEKNKLDCPDEVVQKAIFAGFEPSDFVLDEQADDLESALDELDKKLSARITKDQLDSVLTALALELSDKVFEILRAK